MQKLDVATNAGQDLMPEAAGGQSNDSEPDSYYGILRDVVVELHDGKPQAATASQVRLRMGTVTNGSFSPEKLGLRSFREFLREAEKRQLIALVDRPGDISVVPFETEKLARKPRVRADLWKAIVDWQPRDYAWDLRKGAVVWRDRAQKTESGISQPNEGTLSFPLAEHFILTPKLGESEQLELLRSFIDNLELEGATKGLLLESLDGDRPITNTVDRIKSLGSNLARDWTLVVREAVRDRAEAWKAGDIRLANVDVYDRTLLGTAGSRETAAGRHSPDVVGLRAKIHEAIDRMTEEELRLLHLPAGVLFRET